MRRTPFETEADRQRQRLMLKVMAAHLPGDFVDVPTTMGRVCHDAVWRVGGRDVARVELKFKAVHRFPLWVKTWQLQHLREVGVGLMVWWLEAEGRLLVHRVRDPATYPAAVAFRRPEVARDANDLGEPAVGIDRSLCYDIAEFGRIVRAHAR